MTIRIENMVWCDRVRRVRKLYGMTQEDLAVVLKVRRGTIAVWEARADRPYSADVERFLELEARIPVDAKLEK